MNKGIDYKKYEVICECTFSNLINNNIINNYFTGEVLSMIRQTNLDVLKCYQSVFSFKGFKENYGGLIIICLLLIQLILNFILIKKGFTKERQFAIGLIYSFINLMRNNMSKISDIQFNNNSNIIDIKEKSSDKFNNNKNIPFDIEFISSPVRKKQKKITQSPTNIINIFNHHDIFNNSGSTNKNLLIRSGNKYLSQKIIMGKDNLNKGNEKKLINERGKRSMKKNVLSHAIEKTKNIISKNVKKDINKNYLEDIFPRYQISEKDFLNYMKKDPDDMIYEEALSEDKRKFGTAYKDILFKKQPILNIIFEDNKFRKRIMKIIIHLLTIDLYLVINGLFFSEDYIDEIYLSQKEEKFFSFIPRSIDRIIYTSIVTVIVNFLINCILINEDKIKSTLIREKNDITIMRGEIGNILFQMEKNIKFFIVVNYLIMIFSWYYICCFNHVYYYTKTEWIKSSILILILEEIFPFLYALIIVTMRFLSLYCKSEQIFKISSSL